MDTKKLIKTITLTVFGIIALSVIGSCFTTIKPSERGIMVTLGKPSAEVLTPGMHIHAPFFQHVEKLDMTPLQYEAGFSTGPDGAISSDQQTIGCSFSFIWKYSEDGVFEVLTSYSNREVLKQSVSDLLKEAIKTELGQYEVQNISKEQEKIKSNVLARLESSPQFQKIPVDVKSLAISNYNWSDEYEEKVQETMKKKQEVEKARQDVALIEQEAMKGVKQEEAENQKKRIASETKLEVAKNEAEARKVEAEAQAIAKERLAQAELVEAQKLSQAGSFKSSMWKHEETMLALQAQLEHEKRWNGNLPPNYIPISAAGTIVDITKGR